MNFYKLQGAVTAWSSFNLKHIGFKNIRDYLVYGDTFIINLNDGNQYEITCKKRIL